MSKSYRKTGKFPQDRGNCPSEQLYVIGEEMVVGRKKLDRENFANAFLQKAEFNQSTAEVH